VTCWLVSL